MGCSSGKSASGRQRRRKNRVNPDSFVMKGLENTGRLHFFYHSPLCSLPVRDVTGRHKTEPHIEKCAENYCVQCLQQNIVGLLKSTAKYLFLFTRCKKRGLPFFGKRYVVGYIVKDRWLPRSHKNKTHFAVQGRTKLVSFENGFPLAQLRPKTGRFLRFAKLNRGETERLLQRFGKAPNILRQCVRAVGALQKSPSNVRQPNENSTAKSRH
jgi:hypothetical protein